MKKLLLLSLTLIFISISSCKKEKKESDSIKGTTWSRPITSTTKDYLVFTTSREGYNKEEWEDNGQIYYDIMDFEYEYSNGEGYVDYVDSNLSGFDFTVSGNKLTVEYNGQTFVYTKE